MTDLDHDLDQELVAELDEYHANGARPSYRSTRLDTVQPEQVRWIWPDRLPRGKLVTLDGDPDVGKSTLTVDLVARITTGRAMPGEEAATVPPSAVVLLAAEDGLGDTIRPRLDAAGADPARVHHLDKVPVYDDDGNSRWVPPSIPEDLAALESLIVDTGAVLVVIDVLMAYLSGRADSHRDQDVRRALSDLGEIADRTGATVILLRHLRKSRGSAMYAGGGSIGIIGVARAGMVAAADPDDETGQRRILARSKGNLARPWPSLAYRLVDTGNGVARVEWLGESHHTGDTLLAATDHGEGKSAVDEAADWLRGVLEGGPERYADLERMARAEGIAKTTLFRAREKLGSAVVIERDEQARGRPSTWRLVSFREEMEPNPRNETDTPSDLGKRTNQDGFVSDAEPEAKPMCPLCSTPCTAPDGVHPLCADKLTKETTR